MRKILRMGDPRLRQVAELVPALLVRAFGTPELRGLVTDLKETVDAETGVGLAATQIGVPLRVLVFGYEQNPRYPDAPPVPETVLVNPLIEPLTSEIEEGWEGFLSVPGLRGLVPRCARIRYSGLNPDGRPIERKAEGFHARVVQHECDHLDGMLYPQRMRDLSTLGFIDELYQSGAFGPGAIPCEDEREGESASGVAQ